MAFRRPLFIDPVDNQLREMSDAQIELGRELMFRQYLNSKRSVRLNIGFAFSGVSLGTFVDTRIGAGLRGSRVDRYPRTSEIGKLTLWEDEYDDLKQTLGYPADLITDNNPYPIYYTTDKNIRVMSYQDMIDTYVEPVVDRLIESNVIYTVQAGEEPPDGYDIVNLGIDEVFIDTGSNSDEFPTAGNTDDLTRNSYFDLDRNPITRNKYYLFENDSSLPELIDATAAFEEVAPCRYLPNSVGGDFIDGESSDIDYRERMTRTFENVIDYAIRYTPGCRIRWNINGNGNSCGTWYDTRREGAIRVTDFVNANDYRAQLYPFGGFIVQDTYTLKVGKI